ncbi:MAG: enolase C-terminal domain-like protein [Pseudomonadota bacterium]|nr:enolase C-terminal domain-like protein [Pseudomonadota bacterium]
MKIRSIKAQPVSYRVPEGQNVTLGIGRAVKRDAVLVKVETDEGITGWGEAHHGRAPGAIAKLIDTTMGELLTGMDAAALGTVALAAGENHYTRYEFSRLIEDGAVSFMQPDLSKTGGVSEAMRIAAMSSAWKISFNPHTSLTALNMAASIHALVSVDNPGYFEGDVTICNHFRDELGTAPYSLDKDGKVRPLDGPGIGIEVDESFLAAYPLIDGPCYV